MASHAATVLTHSPVLFLRFGETSGTTAADASGSGNAGTYSGTYTLGQADPLIGDGNTAVYLSETSPGGQVSVPHAAAFNLTTQSTDRWSLEFLFATPSGVAPADTFPRLISKGVSGQTGWGLFIGVNGQAMTLKLAGTSFALAPGAISFIPTFTHVVVVFDGTTMQAYLNGTALTAVTTTAVSSTSTAPLLINQENGAHFGNFAYDELAVYKSALSSADVAALYGSLGNGSAGGGPAYSGSLPTSATGALTLSGIGSTPTSLQLSASGSLDLSGVPAITDVPSGLLNTDTEGTLTLSGSGTWPRLAMTATPEPDNVPPRVRIDIADTRTTKVASVTITRQNADGRSYTVRTSDGGPLAVSGGVATVWDYEAPFGQRVTYTTDVSGGPTATAELDVARPWLVHPGVPSRSVTFRHGPGSHAQETWDIDQGSFKVLRRSTPVMFTSGARTAPAGTLVVLTFTQAELDALSALLSDGSPLFMNVPPSLSWGVDSCYIAVSAVQPGRLSPVLTDPHRAITMPYQVVARPGGGTQAAITWDTIAGQYATWTALAAANTSWADLAAPTG